METKRKKNTSEFIFFISEFHGIPVNILIIVIRVNPVAGIVKNRAAINVIGSIENPNSNSTMKVRPSSAGDDHPSSLNNARVIINKIDVIMKVK